MLLRSFTEYWNLSVITVSIPSIVRFAIKAQSKEILSDFSTDFANLTEKAAHMKSHVHALSCFLPTSLKPLAIAFRFELISILFRWLKSAVQQGDRTNKEMMQHHMKTLFKSCSLDNLCGKPSLLQYLLRTN